MNEKKRKASLIKKIGLGILSVSAILFAILGYMFRLFYANSDIVFNLIILIQVLMCFGLLLLLIESPHEKSGNYLIYMGVGLIIIGILIMIIVNMNVIGILQNFFLFGFSLGYISGPLCILLGILNKKIKDGYMLVFSSLSGGVIFSISFILMTITLAISF